MCKANWHLVRKNVTYSKIQGSNSVTDLCILNEKDCKILKSKAWFWKIIALDLGLKKIYCHPNFLLEITETINFLTFLFVRLFLSESFRGSHLREIEDNLLFPRGGESILLKDKTFSRPTAFIL